MMSEMILKAFVHVHIILNTFPVHNITNTFLFSSETWQTLIPSWNGKCFKSRP